jgi:hypothetical protein
MKTDRHENRQTNWQTDRIGRKRGRPKYMRENRLFEGLSYNDTLRQGCTQRNQMYIFRQREK